MTALTPKQKVALLVFAMTEDGRGALTKFAEARPDLVGAHHANPGTEGECPESSSPEKPVGRAPQGGTG